MATEVDFGGLFRIDLGRSNDHSLYTVTPDEIVSSAISIFTRLISICFTIILIIDYYRTEDYNYFILTLCCFVIPNIITASICVAIYLRNQNPDEENSKSFGEKLKIIIFSKLIIPVLFRYYHSFKYAAKSVLAKKRDNRMEQKKFYDKMRREDSDVSLLRIFECFLELAPQKTLQIIIMIPFTNIRVTQVLTLISSVISLTWCMTSYQKYIRLSQKDKKLMTPKGVILHFIWQFFVTISRILSISIIGSIFPKWTIIGCLIHATIMSLWVLFWDRSGFCHNKHIIWNFLFSYVLGLVYIYNYILPSDGPTKNRYIFYYTLCGIENAVTIYICTIFVTKFLTLYFVLYLVIGISFVLALVSQIIYYSWFHPTLQ